jgi:hypothetical protein
MKNMIKGLLSALVLMASAPALYANIITDTEMQMYRLPFREIGAAAQDLPRADEGQAQDTFNSAVSFESMISQNNDGSLAFLLHVTSGSVYLIDNEIRTAPSQSAPVPEPGSIMLVGFGIMSSSVFFRKQKK